ncbi:hypothetical protein FZEAL_5239 [Fusarium zealandicum]|uniref:Uncharacterized protein n=1 Tax=Fusarium zealandicum TaxID=1053134 RepID=A0A8H4UK93_9HYPO|nr:hypothetical protein FZEAL_5239 [Fusarium zealandicum]
MAPARNRASSGSNEPSRGGAEPKDARRETTTFEQLTSVLASHSASRISRRTNQHRHRPTRCFGSSILAHVLMQSIGRLGYARSHCATLPERYHKVQQEEKKEPAACGDHPPAQEEKPDIASASIFIGPTRSVECIDPPLRIGPALWLP